MKKNYFSGLCLVFISLNVFAQDPPTNAPTPINDLSDVFGIYTSYYGGVSITPSTNTSRATSVYISPNSDEILKYSFKNIASATSNYSVMQFANVDASSYNYVHVDIYVPATGGTTLANTSIKIVDFGADGLNGTTALNADNVEGTATIPTPAPGTWGSFNIPIASFKTGANSPLVAQRAHLSQFLITVSNDPVGTAGAVDNILYVDNLYLSKVSTLPINLVSFKAQSVTNGIALNWNSASEQNFSGFEVQYRTDDTPFSTLTFIAGGKSNYSFIDKNAAAGNNYYRLKMIDNDGAFKYSDVKVVRYGLNDTKLDLGVYPNPVADFANVSFNADVAGASSISLSNIQGSVVKNVSSNVLAGTNTIKLNLSDLANGTYILTVSQNGKIIGTKKLVK